jgi:HTH-type transcriptional regulator / antitoxin HigA
MNDRVPAEVFSPGSYLKEVLSSRGWSQVELSEILGRPPRVVSEIIAAKRAITPATAKALAAALGTSAALWMNLEIAFRLAQTSFEGSKVQQRARLYGLFPVKEMIRRKWIEALKDMDRLERAFCQYFRIDSLEEAPTFEHSAKKHTYVGPPQVSQLAWLIRAEQMARTVKAQSFSVDALSVAIRELKDCLRSIEEVKRAPAILARSGVRLVVVEFLPGAKLDGACFWIDEGSAPVIALSLRFDRLDNFWHTLFHELDHILHGEGKDAPVVDDLDQEREGQSDVPTQEVRANRAAAEMCIDKRKLDDWVARTGRLSKKEIVAFARGVGVHPALVVGQLQHRGLIPYSFHRDLLEKVRELVIESTVTDGFRVRR